MHETLVDTSLPDVLSVSGFEPLPAHIRRFWQQHVGCDPIRRLCWRKCAGFRLQGDIPDAVSRQLLELCLGACDTFSLTESPWGGSDKLRRLLQPYQLAQLETARWFCYAVPANQPLHVRLYRLNAQSAALLRLFCGNLFLHCAEHGSRYAQDLEDLCFFRRGTLILGTVSHEHICQTFPPDAAFRTRLLRSCSLWQPCGDTQEQIFLRRPAQ